MLFSPADQRVDPVGRRGVTGCLPGDALSGCTGSPPGFVGLQIRVRTLADLGRQSVVDAKLRQVLHYRVLRGLRGGLGSVFQSLRVQVRPAFGPAR